MISLCYISVVGYNPFTGRFCGGVAAVAGSRLRPVSLFVSLREIIAGDASTAAVSGQDHVP